MNRANVDNFARIISGPKVLDNGLSRKENGFKVYIQSKASLALSRLGTHRMVQLLAVTDYITSLAEAEQIYGLAASTAPAAFFTEWTDQLEDLSETERERLDLIKRRYLYHRQHGHLLENAVSFLVVSPLLELTGLYDPPFLRKSEASVRFEFVDENQKIYQGRINALIVLEDLWIVLVESKRTSFDMTTALPQALAYMASGNSSRPKFGLVSNGEQSMFVKLEDGQYAFSDDFSLNRRRNELWDVLQILNRLKISASRYP